jgi:hypothetical protein
MINVKTESNKNRNFDHDSFLDFVSAFIVATHDGNTISTHEVLKVSLVTADYRHANGGGICQYPNRLIFLAARIEILKDLNILKN